MNFGAFVELADGIEGLVHVSEISADKRVAHPSDDLRVGQKVKAQILAIDTDKHQIKLSMKQLIPTDIDEYIAEHKAGDVVTGRVIEQLPNFTIVELGEGIRSTCPNAGTCGAAAAPSAPTATKETKTAPKVDLSSLSSMLKDRWKGNTVAASAQPEPLGEGQIRSFKVVKLDPETKKIEVELA
jgi:small subunit ribosomal protein S1